MESPVADVTLSDGTRVRIRPMAAHDDARLVAFHDRLSPESRRLRFFSPHPRLSEKEVTRFTQVDGDERVALVADCDGDIVAVARFDREPETTDAEAAFVVQDSFQGRGLGFVLLQQLAAGAREHGIERLVATTLPENNRMLHVFRKFSSEVKTSFRDGVVHVTIPLG